MRVIAGTEFKLKYMDSALGYVWSVLKPLAYFGVLVVVFGSLFHLNRVFSEYPTYLLMGIVVYTFFSDAGTNTMWSFVLRAPLIRKLAFPRIVIPVAATTVSAITLVINSSIVAAFIVWRRITPRLDWLFLPLYLLEIYVFTLGVSLILATLFVRFRDIGQAWELGSQVLYWATPIVYPVSYLPSWARPVALLNPLAQAIQDMRHIILYHAPQGFIVTAPDVLGGSVGRLYPIGIAVAVLALGVAVYRHEEPWLAERV